MNPPTSTRPPRTVYQLYALGMLIVFVCGCGSRRPPAFPAQGRVTFTNGSPVKTGTVELKSREHGTHARGDIQPDGTFVLTTYDPGDGAVAGKHDCVVVQMVLAEDSPIRSHGTYGVVHPRFSSYASSGLSCVIEPSEDNLIALTVEGVGKLSSGGSEKDHKH